MNGYASNIAVALHKDGASNPIQTWPRDSGGPAPADETTADGSDLHGRSTPAENEGQNYKRLAAVHGVWTSVLNALHAGVVATVRRDGATYEQKYKQGEPVGGSRRSAGARQGTTVFSGPIRRSSEDGIRRGRHS